MNSSSERTIALVFGYIPEIDYSNKFALDNGLPKRFAVALDTHRSSSDSMFFDYQLLQRIIGLILPWFACDRLVVSFEGSKVTREPGHFEVYEFGDDGPEPFTHLELFSGKTPVCYIQTAFYNAVGGPFPYHDTFTFSFYCRSYNMEAVKNKIDALQTEAGFRIRDIIYGGDQPDISLMTKLKNLL